MYFHTTGAESSVEAADSLGIGLEIGYVRWCVKSKAQSVEVGDVLAVGEIDTSVRWCVRSKADSVEAADALAVGLIDVSVRSGCFCSISRPLCVGISSSSNCCSSSRWLCMEGISVIKRMNAFRLIRPHVPIMSECLAICVALASPAIWQQNGDEEGSRSQTFK